ncbi:hypothetical protein HELRODRAFT_169610 [Helobdella robusta]|uniref:Tick transposon n=1 Tax=Helobdella robusta TaxID=6412 RepID=T1F259_HELRO|nr:hypothetical protein HELRODRAFT_169610 [Helobdella robusta]ESO07907.1 hypothetical protein HELRODRAFT_169610 [Helobdella robusta]
MAQPLDNPMVSPKEIAKEKAEISRSDLLRKQEVETKELKDRMVTLKRMENNIQALRDQLLREKRVISKIKNKLNKPTLIDLYYSLIFPHLIYCNVIWGNSPDIHLKQLTKCQNRFIRIFKNLHPHCHTSEYYLEMKILNIKNLFIYHVATFIFRFLRQQLPAFFRNFFTFGTSIQARTTRHTPLFYAPPARIKVLCMSLKHTGPGIWETIPQEIKDCNTLHLFKNKLKNFLITKSSVFQG